MSFEEKCVSWFNLLYKNPKSKVRINGQCSDYFKVDRGGHSALYKTPTYISPTNYAMLISLFTIQIKDLDTWELYSQLVSQNFLTPITIKYIIH